MPVNIPLRIKGAGWDTILIYSESEMSEALRLDRAELGRAIDRGALSYSYHKTATNDGEYRFTQLIYNLNKEYWSCLQSGGHYFDPGEVYDPERAKKVYKCSSCPAKKYD